jgi:glutathione S-transferase
MVWHAMAAEVQLFFGTNVSKLPADNLYFTKGRHGFEGALQWLEANLTAVRAALPEHDVSVLEVALFCVLEHIAFRETVPLSPYPTLRAFAAAFRERPSAVATPYQLDAPA